MYVRRSVLVLAALAVLVIVAVALWGTQQTSESSVDAVARDSAAALARTQRASAMSLYRTQLDTCARGNRVREESNRRAGEHAEQDRIIGELLLTAERRARDEFRRQSSPVDAAAVTRYRDLRRQLGRLKFAPQRLVDCARVVRHP
jgi:type II secretory pathway pseudopilin PulG